MSETVEVLVGVIGRAHGLRGEMAVELRTDEPARRFAAGQVVRGENGGPRLTVASAREHSGRLLVAFDHVADRTAVEALRGVRLVADVPTDELPSDEEEFFDRQLVGLRVLDAAGTEVGEVTGVLHLPVQDMLEVGTAQGSSLVPFVAALVPEVNLRNGFLRLADVQGLLGDQST